jgi:ferredoxin
VAGSLLRGRDIAARQTVSPPCSTCSLRCPTDGLTFVGGARLEAANGLREHRTVAMGVRRPANEGPGCTKRSGGSGDVTDHDARYGSRGLWPNDPARNLPAGYMLATRASPFDSPGHPGETGDAVSPGPKGGPGLTPAAQRRMIKRSAVAECGGCYPQCRDRCPPSAREAALGGFRWVGVRRVHLLLPVWSSSTCASDVGASRQAAGRSEAELAGDSSGAAAG